ncbi:MAG: S8 family serine peptidase, partial [Ignavibacteria bacterium]|nr:S8 family serine peptidase [Ignavibacteria bacterium]
HNTGQQINGGRTGTADADVDGPEAWQVAQGAGIVVAVIDEGVDTGNPDFQASRLVAGYDFGDDDNNPSPGGNGAHGTACAGIVGATQGNNLGVTGIAPGCTIMPIKIWRDDGTSATVADIADAIDFAWRNGADVLSNSWGFSSSAHNLFPAIDEAIDSAAARGRNGLGSLVFFAAGNTADHGNASNGYVAYPGNYDSVVTVGASDRNDDQANYSPTDDEIDVVAPSHRAYRCQDAAEDLEVWTTDITGNPGYNPWHETDACLPPNGTELPVGDRDFTGLMGGTSAACPLTAGIGALLLSVNPSLTRLEAEDIIKGSADKIRRTTGNYDATGFSRRFGHGRANAHRAIVPSVSITVKPEKVGKGDPFEITVTASAPFGLQSLWWFGENTGIPDVDMAHMQSVSGAGKVYTYTWTTSINSKGTYRLGANARDVLYPNPGDGFPHQASEGSGIAYATIKVPTFAEWAAILTAVLFVFTFVVQQPRRR